MASGKEPGAEEASAGGGRPISIAYLGDPNSVHVRRWAAEFDRRGHEITLLVPGGLEVVPGLPSSIAVERFTPHTAMRMRRLGLIATRRSVREAVARVRPDILHVHHLTVNGFRAWMSGHHPYVVTVWGDDVLIDVKRSRPARLLARLTLRSADLVTGISRHVVDGAIRAGAPAERTRVIHFGVDVDLFSPGANSTEESAGAARSAALRERLRLAGKRILFSPRIVEPVYRHEVAIAALAQLPDDVVMIMTRYAPDPATLAAVERQIAGLGLTDRVHIVPPIAHSEMPDYYRLAEAVVSVPESDAGPVTLVEALGVGRPVVSSDLPPVREWLAELDPECLVPVGDVPATVAALRAVLARTPEQRAEVAARGRAAVLERADQRRTMDVMEDEYRKLAARRLIQSRG